MVLICLFSQHSLVCLNTAAQIIQICFDVHMSISWTIVLECGGVYVCVGGGVRKCVCVCVHVCDSGWVCLEGSGRREEGRGEGRNL